MVLLLGGRWTVPVSPPHHAGCAVRMALASAWISSDRGPAVNCAVRARTFGTGRGLESSRGAEQKMRRLEQPTKDTGIRSVFAVQKLIEFSAE